MKLFYWQVKKELGGRFIFVIAKDRTAAINHIIKEFIYQYRIEDPLRDFDNELMGLDMKITEVDLSKVQETMSFFLDAQYTYGFDKESCEVYVDQELVTRKTLKRGI